MVSTDHYIQGIDSTVTFPSDKNMLMRILVVQGEGEVTVGDMTQKIDVKTSIEIQDSQTVNIKQLGGTSLIYYILIS